MATSTQRYDTSAAAGAGGHLSSPAGAAAAAAVGRLLPQTPTFSSRVSSPTVSTRSSLAAVHPNSFSYAHSYKSTAARHSSRNEISRSYSDNKHYDNPYTAIQYRRTKLGPTNSETPTSSQSPPQHAALARISQQQRQSPSSSPAALGQQQPSPRTRTSVLRSQSHVTARSSHSRPIVTEKTSGRTRYSCDATAATPSSTNGAIQLTLVLMGAPMVGKSAIVNQFLFEIFQREYRPTVEEFNWIEYGSDGADTHPDGRPEQRRRYSSSNFSSNSSVDSTESERSSSGGSAAGARQNLLLQIIDSAGSRDFLAMRHLYYGIGDAFMIIYSVKDPMSYAEALLMVREIQQRNSKNVPILLVANKTDLEDESAADFDINLKCRPAILATFPVPQNIDFMRLSAKNLNQVKQAFNRLIDELAQKREICGGVLRRAQLQKRRQSMPSRRTANELGIDAETLERLLRQHDNHTRHSQCIIS